MHDELAKSLAHIADAANHVDNDITERLRKISSAISSGTRVKPLGFRKYYDLVRHLAAEDITSAKADIDRLEKLLPRASRRTVHYFGHPHVDDLGLELLHDGMRLAPISGQIAFDFLQILNEGLALMHDAVPEMYSEVDALVREVILARAPHGDKMEFDGASHYQFWGLLLLNPMHHKTPLEVLEVLAHEASHSFLFGLTVEEPLVLNEDDELYPSPLRSDLRPMDGIYHAAYVSARMCWAMEQVSTSGYLTKDERNAAKKAASSDRENYLAGLDVINSHASLTNTGREILESAAEHLLS